MEWSLLINDTRLGLEDYKASQPDAGTRSDFRRDYDRLVFSSPFRRLQNKTQVFPLPGSIFVHNRLTHSLEVSSVGKSLADTVANALMADKYRDAPFARRLPAIGDIVAAACLAHDLGNPPFGHSGEKAISTFFSEGEGAKYHHYLTDEQWADFTNFEGNANSLRLLTHKFNGRRKGGFAMTYSTLATIVKYPYESALAGEHGKFGFFDSERDIYRHVASTLGIRRLPQSEGRMLYARHPLTFLLEAADDICYEIMDLEDAHKLKILTTREVTDALMAYIDPDKRAYAEGNVARVEDPNEKIAYLRSKVIGILVKECAQAFLRHEDAILDGTFGGSLIEHVSPVQREAYQGCVDLSWAKIYRAPEVVDIELAGNRIITHLLEKLSDAVMRPHLNYSRLMLERVPSQYDVRAHEPYHRLQAVLDHVSAMTDVYALDLFRRLNGMSIPSV